MPRVIAFAGMAVVLATPFVHNLNQLPWPLVDLFGAIAGLTTGVVVLATRNLFGEHRQLLRHCVGWGLVLLGTNSAMPPPLPMALVVGTSSFKAETNAFWFCELAPGVYLHCCTR